MKGGLTFENVSTYRANVKYESQSKFDMLDNFTHSYQESNLKIIYLGCLVFNICSFSRMVNASLHRTSKPKNGNFWLYR